MFGFDLLLASDRGEGEEPDHGGPVDGDIDELVVEQVEFVVLLGDEGGDHVLGDLHGEAHVELAEDIGPVVDDRCLLPEKVPRLAADGDEGDLFPLAWLFLHEPFGGLDQVVVEAPAEPPVGGHADHPDPFRFADRQKRMGLGVHPERQTVQNLHELHRIGPEVLHPRLGGLELRGGHHVHGPGDLPGLLNGGDLPFNILECGHSKLLPLHVLFLP